MCVHVNVLTGSFYEAHVDHKLQTSLLPPFRFAISMPIWGEFFQQVLFNTSLFPPKKCGS